MSQNKGTPTVPTDIDELRAGVAQMEAHTSSLKEKQLMYEQLLDSMRDMIFVKSRKSTILYANKSMCELYGMTKAQICGITDSTFNNPDFTAQYLKDDAYVMETGNTLVIAEEPVIRHDGTVRMFETIKTPIRGDDAQVKAMVGISRDITERTLADDDRKRAEKALDDAERLFRQMAESMRDVFWVGTPDLESILYISPAYETTWGRPCKELLQDSKSFLKVVYPEDLPEFQRRIEAMLEAGDGSFGYEFRIVRPDGIRWLWARTFPAYDKNGKLERIYGITHDISARKEVERRVNEFNSMVSHELRTPLTSIRASLGLIVGGQTEPVGSETGDLLQIALAECDRMIRLINDLLDIKNIEADSLELKLASLRADETVAAVLSAHRSVAASAGVTLQSDVDCDGQFIADSDRIIQVLANLLSNAIKVSTSGQTVLVSVADAPFARLRFSVEDAGPGIPDSEQAKLFTAFQQIDSSDSRDRGGTGLGLAISKAIVEKHGGTIGFRSSEGQGSSFWFELPKEPPSVEMLG